MPAKAKGLGRRPVLVGAVVLVTVGIVVGTIRWRLGNQRVTERGPTPDEEMWGCYGPAARSNPDLRGEIMVSFNIATSGQVEEAKIIHSTLNAPDVEMCVVAVVNRWKLANPSGAVLKGVRTSFRFPPRGSAPTRMPK
jgi:TonB family protein